MRVELVTLCKHGLVKNHDYGPPHDPIECLGGSRSTVSGFSPEAVQAAAKALYDLDDVSVETWEDAAYDAEVRDWYRGMARAALQAAWATDFGDPSDYQGADHE